MADLVSYWQREFVAKDLGSQLNEMYKLTLDEESGEERLRFISQKLPEVYKACIKREFDCLKQYYRDGQEHNVPTSLRALQKFFSSADESFVKTDGEKTANYFLAAMGCKDHKTIGKDYTAAIAQYAEIADLLVSKGYISLDDKSALGSMYVQYINKNGFDTSGDPISLFFERNGAKLNSRMATLLLEQCLDPDVSDLSADGSLSFRMQYLIDQGGALGALEAEDALFRYLQAKGPAALDDEVAQHLIAFGVNLDRVQTRVENNRDVLLVAADNIEASLTDRFNALLKEYEQKTALINAEWDAFDVLAKKITAYKNKNNTPTEQSTNEIAVEEIGKAFHGTNFRCTSLN